MKLLISACLLGDLVRYDGQSKALRIGKSHPLFSSTLANNLYIKICPEVAGGLSVPRPPAEIIRFNSGVPLVKTNDGQNVSQAFIKGAHSALEIVKLHNIKLALLKANSPSCSNDKIHDGCFNQILIDGLGVTANLLQKHGVKVFNETQLDQLELELHLLE